MSSELGALRKLGFGAQVLGFFRADARIWHRPPLQGTDIVYGRRARQDDALVLLWTRLAVSLSIVCPGLVRVLENSVGSLERRPYMAYYSEGLVSVVQTIETS